MKGAFVGTEAAASLAMFTSKSAAFWAFSALPWDIVSKDLVVGSTLMIGARTAKSLVSNINADTFNWLMDGSLLVAGAAMIFSALLSGA